MTEGQAGAGERAGEVSGAGGAEGRAGEASEAVGARRSSGEASGAGGAGDPVGRAGGPDQVGASRSSERDPAEAPPGRIAVRPGVAIDPRELAWRFSTSGGPGGQHVNTSNTRAEVTFDIAGSSTLPLWARERLVERLGPSVTVAAGDRRSQARNRDLAVERLVARLGRALEERRARRATRPTRASQRRRVESKRRRGDLKQQRQRGKGGSAREDE